MIPAFSFTFSGFYELGTNLCVSLPRTRYEEGFIPFFIPFLLTIKCTETEGIEKGRKKDIKSVGRWVGRQPFSPDMAG